MEEEQREKIKDELTDKLRERDNEAAETEKTGFEAVDGDDEDQEPQPTGFEAVDGVDETDLNEDDVDADADAGDTNTDTDEPSGDQEGDEIGQDLLFRAAQAGFSYDEVQEYGTAKAMEAAISREAKKAGKDTVDGGDAGDDAQQDNEVMQIGEFQELEIPEDLDEDAAELFGKFQDQARANHAMMVKMSEGFQQTRETNQQLQQQRDLRFAKDFDSRIMGLDAEWQDTIGKGSINDLAKDSAQAQNRVRIYKEVMNQRLTHPDWDMDKLAEVAIGITFPEQAKRTTVNNAKKVTEEHRQSRSTARPAKRRKQSVRNPRAEAKKGLISNLKKLMGRS